MVVEFSDSTDVFFRLGSDRNAGAIVFGTRLVCDSRRKN